MQSIKESKIFVKKLKIKANKICFQGLYSEGEHPSPAL